MRKIFRPLLLVILNAMVLLLAATAQQKTALPQTPVAVKDGKAKLVGHYNPTQKLRLVIGLKPPHLKEEEEFLAQLQDRNSPLFHQYLTQEQWNARFAPAVAEEEAVVQWATAQGLTITQRYANRLLVDVEAPVAVIEKALDVTINQYQLGSTCFYSNDKDPSLPSSLANIVQSIAGLNSLARAHSGSRRLHDDAEPVYHPGPVFAVGEHEEAPGNHALWQAALAEEKYSGPLLTQGAYDPTDLYSSQAYDYAALSQLGHCCNPLNYPGNSPPEASIAIIIWDDVRSSDVQGFIRQYPYLAYNYQTYFIDGSPPPDTDGEVTLDVEWSTASANSFSSNNSNTSKIFVYEGVDNQFSTLEDAINRALSDGNARVLSMSWGCVEITCADETAMNTMHGIFNQMVGEGWTLVAAAGDQGATTDCLTADGVSYPASDPDVVAAGGTTLRLQGGNYASEYAWTGGPEGCAANDGGTGGGCSVFFPAPLYQPSTSCGGYRSLPDVALNADFYYAPQNFYFEGRLQPTGGTSIATPELAGFFAQENAYLLYIQSIVGRSCGPNRNAACAPLGNGDTYLYYLGNHPNYAAHYPFYDILSGCNNNNITQEHGLRYFCASPGYDQVTGWGSVNMLQLAWGINTYQAGDGAGPLVSFSGLQTNHYYNTDQTLNWTISGTSSNGHPPNGVAGYTLAWDSAPSDPTSEATPGTGNSFYSGPAVANATYGSVDLASDPGQGCHTAYLRSWDNAGQSSVSSYGPLCYDTSPPVTTASLSGNQQGGNYVGPVQVSLTATDNASGVAATYYEVDGNGWQTYTAPFTVTVPGTHRVGFYSVDVAHNQEATQYVTFTILLEYLLTVQVSSGGTVASTDGFINCPGACTFAYAPNSPVTLNAAAYPEFTFGGWSGACSGTGACTVTMTQNLTVSAAFNANPYQFVAVTPCRLVDTRGTHDPIQAGTSQNYAVPQLGGCNIPPSAAAYSLNVTALPHGQLGYLTIWPAGESQPLASTLNSPDGRTKANAAIVPAGAGGAVSVYVTDTSDLILDIDGYFAPASLQTLQFYPLTPCRLVDTRGGDGPLGGPRLPAQMERDFPLLMSSCIPPQITPAAYSLNFTAVPNPSNQHLGYLSVWPFGQTQPVVSTLNNPTGTVVANAAIVPAGLGGEIAVYAYDTTDLLIDIDGYFAAPAQGGYSFYAAVPCRVIDTRGIGDGQPFNGMLAPPVNVVESACAPPSTAMAYILNATVVPANGPMGFLTLWPVGQPQPVVSTLNAYDGLVTSNMAIVPNLNGSVNAYADGYTQLILDISGYFAP